MTLRRRFSWTVAGCLIVLAAFVAGCSLDSGNPLSTSDSNESSQWTADDAYTPQVMAKKKVRINYDAPDTGGSKGKGKGKKQTSTSSADAQTAPDDTQNSDNGDNGNSGVFVPVQISPSFQGKMSDKEYITRSGGGVLQLISNDEETKIQVALRTGSVPEDTWMTLTLLDSGLLDFTVKPSMELGKAAKLKVKGTFLVPKGQIGLFHDEGNGEWSKVANAKVSEGNDGLVEIEADIRILLNHFSRYAFGSRL